MDIVFAFLPIVFTMLCGYSIAQAGTLKQDGWKAVETLSFNLLIPVVLIKSIAFSDLVFDEFGRFIAATVLTVSLAAVAVFVLRAIVGVERLPNPDFTTLFQTTTRWNAFIALAAAELFAGPDGLTLVAAAMAILVPLINIVNILVLARYGNATLTKTAIVFQVAKNPLVIGCILGLLINISKLHLPIPIVETLDLIGRSALGIGLLTVGAALSFRRLLNASWSVVIGVAFRSLVIPSVFLTVAALMGLNYLETLAGLLVLAVPAASNGYIVAKQMGGNAELYADILSWQTVLSMLTLPIFSMMIGFA